MIVPGDRAEAHVNALAEINATFIQVQERHRLLLQPCGIAQLGAISWQISRRPIAFSPVLDKESKFGLVHLVEFKETLPGQPFGCLPVQAPSTRLPRAWTNNRRQIIFFAFTWSLLGKRA